MVGVGDVAAEDAVLHLRRRFVHRILVGIVEGVEEADELVAHPGLHAEIIDMEEVALLRQRLERHRLPPFAPSLEDSSDCAAGKERYTEHLGPGGMRCRKAGGMRSAILPKPASGRRRA